MSYWRSLLEQRGVSVLCSLGLAMALVLGCATAASAPTNAAAVPVTGSGADYVVPAGFFGKPASDTKQATASTAATPTPATAAAIPYLPALPLVPKVLLYASPTTSTFLAAGGIDAKDSIRTWEGFLRKYKIPFQLVSSVETLEKLQPGVLLLPSAVALSEREKQAVIDFRAKGGGVLATWLTGVRSEKGEWRGPGFMESALDVKVVGNTEADENDIFMMVHGDNPVVHNLPAGQRVWLERVKGWYPLRLVGSRAAANIMDWSRSYVPGKPTTTIVFDERLQRSGHLSRSVILGYPERLWLSADPHLIEAIAHNALMWLLRQPDAFVSAWPYPYSSALLMAVDSADVIAELDFDFAKQLEEAGGRATYYVLSENATKSADILKKIQARGHEVGFLGDSFKGFKDQSSNEQAKRLDAIRSELKTAGIDAAVDAGFHAPMESYDKTTEKLLKERAFGHYIAFMDASEARLPFIAPNEAGIGKPAKAVVVLPRTQNGPEDDEREGADGMRDFLGELALAEQMAGLSVVRMPNQSVLDKAQLTEMFRYLKSRNGRMWLANGTQLAEWWRERERLSASLVSSPTGPLLNVSIAGATPLQKAAMVWVNLPQAGSSLRLVARGSYAKQPKIANVDSWRIAVVLDGFAPGEYQWNVYFDNPKPSVSK